MFFLDLFNTTFSPLYIVLAGKQCTEHHVYVMHSSCIIVALQNYVTVTSFLWTTTNKRKIDLSHY